MLSSGEFLDHQMENQCTNVISVISFLQTSITCNRILSPTQGNEHSHARYARKHLAGSLLCARTWQHILRCQTLCVRCVKKRVMITIHWKSIWECIQVMIFRLTWAISNMNYFRREAVRMQHMSEGLCSEISSQCPLPGSHRGKTFCLWILQQGFYWKEVSQWSYANSSQWNRWSAKMPQLCERICLQN